MYTDALDQSRELIDDKDRAAKVAEQLSTYFVETIEKEELPLFSNLNSNLDELYSMTVMHLIV